MASVKQTAGRVQLDQDGIVLFHLGLVNGARDVFRGNGVDGAMDNDLQDIC